MKRKYGKRKKYNLISIITIIIMSFVLFLTIGFSMYSETLSLGNLGANVEVQADIKISNISLDSTSNNAVSNWENHTHNSIDFGISMPNEESSVTYAVEITNLGNTDMAISDISGLPDNLDYSISNYSLRDILCDDNDSNHCSLGSVSTIYITIGYNENGFDEDNTSYNLKLNYTFKRVHKISYAGISGNYPKTALHGEDVHINFASPYPNALSVSGSSSYSYINESGLLSIINITNDITITCSFDSYFVEYDGSIEYDNSGTIYYKTFGEFDNTNITAFQRNTTLNLQQVLSMVDEGTAKIISTSENDPNYPSLNPIYGWVTNNILYWWSESETAYFHPNTKSAFRNMGKVVTIDLNDTSTSKVKNFANWFDKDRLLKNINGKINTSGLVLEYNDSFNYATDPDENNSSGKGLAFMFNDCNALTSIDLSEFYTTNASDMKRMFAGCSSITTLDLSDFDTKNVKSMYWMFRKMSKLKNIDLSHFNTIKVENMLGMFLTDTALVTVKFGEQFDTRNVRVTRSMFGSNSSLTTIYAKKDFNTSSLISSAQMFNGAKRLVGASGTSYAVPYNSSHLDAAYAKIATPSIPGYFTLDEVRTRYYITYDLSGGESSNPSIFYEDSQTFTLEPPKRLGYTFIGWTGSNGDVPQSVVTINTGTTENLHFVAHYQAIPGELFPKVFSISGTCKFNGSTANVSGDTCINDFDETIDYTNNKYIDTGINLYNSSNYTKDFEIYFEIDEYSPTAQEVLSGNIQNTIMNSKAENITNYPGVLLRKSSNNLEAKSFNKAATKSYDTVTSFKIARVNRVIYYSFNNGPYTQLDDNSSYDNTFDLSVWFGASKNSSGKPFRYSKATLSNIYIKLGTYSLQ